MNVVAGWVVVDHAERDERSARALVRAHWGEVGDVALDAAFRENFVDARRPMQDQRLAFVHIVCAAEGVLDA